MVVAGALAEKNMAKKQAGRPPTSDRNDIVVKLDRTVAAQARYIAETRDISMAEYLTVVLAPIVARDFHAVTKGGKP